MLIILYVAFLTELIHFVVVFWAIIRCKIYAHKLKANVSGWDEKVNRPLGKWCVATENY